MRAKFQSIILYFLLFVPFTLVAQISVTGKAFPSVGDTFLIATDRLPYQIIIGPQGEAQTWDFTTVQSPFAQRALLLPFENRTHLETLDQADAIFMGYYGSDAFVKIDENNIVEVGRRISNPLQPGEKIDAVFDTPRLMFEPIEFGDVQSADYQLTAPIPVEPFSFEIGNEWARRLDGIRIVWDIHIEIEADAWGLLRIPFGRYQVLRQKVQEQFNPHIEIMDGQGNWISGRNYSSKVPELKAYESEYFMFWSNELNHPPAVVIVEPGSQLVKKVHYKAFAFGSRILNEMPKGTDVFVYPNPTFDFARFDFINLPKGKYLVDIYNILGVRMQSFEVDVDGYTTAEFDLTDLKKGTYIYRIRNDQNRTITSKRLIIIQP